MIPLVEKESVEKIADKMAISRWETVDKARLYYKNSRNNFIAVADPDSTNAKATPVIIYEIGKQCFLKGGEFK